MVAVNVTVTEPTVGGFLTVYPSGRPLPLASNLNVRSGQTVPNLVLARVGADGRVHVFLSAGMAHVVFDVVGWFANSEVREHGHRMTLQPAHLEARLLDTRSTSKVGPGRWIDVHVPEMRPGMSAVAVNVTATEPTTSTYVTAYPADRSAPPLASNLNVVAGQTRANLVFVRLSADGSLRLYNHLGSTHLIVDLLAIWTPAPDFPPTDTAGRIVALDTPTRVIDTRGGPPLPGGYVETWNLHAAEGQLGVPIDGLMVNATGTEATKATHLTVFDRRPSVPLRSTLNLVPGEHVPNMAVSPLSLYTDELSIYNNSGTVHYLIDVSAVLIGYDYVPPPVPNGLTQGHRQVPPAGGAAAPSAGSRQPIMVGVKLAPMQ